MRREDVRRGMGHLRQLSNAVTTVAAAAADASSVASGNLARPSRVAR